MTTFEQIIRIGMMRTGISSVARLAERTGVSYATINRRFRSPQGCLAYEMEAFADVLGLEIGEIAESCRKKKGKKIV